MSSERYEGLGILLTLSMESSISDAVGIQIAAGEDIRAATVAK